MNNDNFSENSPSDWLPPHMPTVERAERALALMLESLALIDALEAKYSDDLPKLLSTRGGSFLLLRFRPDIRMFIEMNREILAALRTGELQTDAYEDSEEWNLAHLRRIYRFVYSTELEFAAL